jgi:hypothetical protein
MNKAILAPLAAVAAFGVGLVAAPLAQSQISDFVINNADATNTFTMAPAAPLNTLANDITPRFVVEYANTLKVYPIAPPSSTLMSLLGQTADRFVLQYANANRFYALGYPKELFNDQTPPQISDLKATVTKTITGTNLVTVTWLVNEVVTTTFEYGFAPGLYTGIFTDVLLFRLHEFGIWDVPTGATIYYRIHHIDRSGNELRSGEYTYTVPLPTVTPLPPKRYVYVPLVRR